VKEALKKERKTWLVGTADHDPTLYKSARNIRGVEVMPAAQFNTYAVLRPRKVLLTRAALEALRKPAEKKAKAKPEAAPAAAQQP
jgi:large subunit ribosomal protein L4